MEIVCPLGRTNLLSNFLDNLWHFLWCVYFDLMALKFFNKPFATGGLGCRVCIYLTSAPFQRESNLKGWKNNPLLQKLIHESWNWPSEMLSKSITIFVTTALSTVHEILKVFYLIWVSDGEVQPNECLPVNDVLDVFMHTLVVSPPVWLDVKCNLGKHAERHITGDFTCLQVF